METELLDPAGLTNLDSVKTMEDMDALMERVLNERIRVLQEKVEVATRQRDRLVRLIPHNERSERIKEFDDEMDRAGQPKKPGQVD